nr:hypothetical protein [Deltaproteobacteria bacterium]
MPRQVYFLVFLLIVLSALTLAHYFLYRKICKTFSPGKKARTTLLAVFAAFICSPLIIGAFSLYTIPYLSYFTSLTIYLWFAFLYYLFIFLFIIFIFNFISKKFTAAIYNQHHQAFLFIPALLSILIVLYGIFE